jgi:hypothetical protein
MSNNLRPNKKGQPRRGGRAKGTPNKQTASVKEAIALAFEGIGGVPALIRWAKRNREAFYCRLLTKLVPSQVDGSLMVYGSGMPTEEESRAKMRQVLGMVAPELVADDADDDESDDAERFAWREGMNGGDGER